NAFGERVDFPAELVGARKTFFARLLVDRDLLRQRLRILVRRIEDDAALRPDEFAARRRSRAEAHDERREPPAAETHHGGGGLLDLAETRIARRVEHRRDLHRLIAHEMPARVDAVDPDVEHRSPAALPLEP